MTRETPSRAVDNAAEAYVRVLEDHGVSYFFNSPGSEDSPFWEYFAGRSRDGDDAPSVAHVNCRHESVAVNMAKGYTLLTGEPQAVKLHVNVGPLHAAMDIYGAHHASIPMLLLGSYNATHEHERPGGTSGPHYLDYQQPGGHENNAFRYTKWCSEIQTNDNAERVLDRAFRMAESAPQGPVFVTAREELLHEDTKDSVDLVHNEPSRSASIAAERLAALATALSSAENPLFIVGSVGRDEAARSALQELAERLAAPVFETQKRQYNFPTDHPLFLGASSGTAASVEPYFAYDFDLVAVFGCAKPWYPPETNAPDADVVIVNRRPVREHKAYWNYPAEQLIDADPGAVLSQLADVVDRQSTDGGADWAAVHEERARRWQRRVAAGSDSVPIDPFWLCARLDDRLPTDAIVCDETILHSSVIANEIGPSEGRSYLNASRLNGGGLGSGLGLAMGAKLAAPDRFTTVLVGDGSYHYNPVTASYGTAQECGLPFLTVVFNNGGYQSMKATLRSTYPDGRSDATGSYVGSTIEPDPSYAEEMDVWGGHGETVTDPDALGPALDRALAAVEDGQLALVDVTLEPDPPEYPDPVLPGELRET